METTLTKKMSLGITIAALAIGLTSRLAPASYLRALSENEFIQLLKKKLTQYNAHLPEDRVYVQLDKPLYEPGDDIWLSAYVLDGATLKPSTKSDIVYVELINPKGAVERKLSIIGKKGKAAGDFKLDKEAAGGLYKIRAYTNWMKNDGEASAFEKEIQVQSVILPNLKMKLDFERKAFGAGDQVIARLELNSNENKPLTNYKLKFAASLAGAKILEQEAITDEEGVKYIRFDLPKNLLTNDGLLNVMIDYNGSTESISRAIPIVLNKIDFAMYPEGGDLVCGLENNVAFRAMNEFGKPADVEGCVMNDKGKKLASFSSFHQGMGAFKLVPQQGEKYTVKLTKPANIEQSYKVPEPLLRGYVMNADNAKQGEVGVRITTTEAGSLTLVAQVRGTLYYSTVINPVKGVNTFTFSTSEFPIGVAQLTLFDPQNIARAERLIFVNKHKQMHISVEAEKEKYLPREKVKLTIAVKDERGLPMPANLSMAVVNDQLLSFADDKSGNLLSQLVLQQDVKEKIEEPAFYFNSKESKADKALDYLLMTAGWRRFTWEKVLEQDLPPIRYTSQKAVFYGSILDGVSYKPVAGAKITGPRGETFTTDSKGDFSIPYDLTDAATFQFHAADYREQGRYINNYEDKQVVYLYRKDYQPQPAFSFSRHSAKTMGANREMEPEAVATPAAMEESVRDGARPEPAKKEVMNRLLAAAPVIEAAADEVAEMPVVVNDKWEEHEGKRKQRIVQKIVVPEHTVYHRARQFAAPVYAQQQQVETRSDFRSTLYWNPNIEIGYTGKTTIEFYASDDISSFKATVEGIGRDGLAGRGESSFYTQLPFAMSTKVPLELVTEDVISIPLTLKNNTGDPLGGQLSIQAPEGLTALSAVPAVQTIMPGKAKTIYLDYKVGSKTGEGAFTIGFKSCGLSDAFAQQVKIVPKGFPVQTSFSSQDQERSYAFEITHLVQGSLKASFTAFPNVVSDLMKGVEGILQEPYGCFEQTSCTAYPNAMVLEYLRSVDSKDDRTLARATDLLDRGYKRLTTFEAGTKGYEWFGASPAHEGLTAYGIMEFVDMKKAGQPIDNAMLDRTAQWLLSHRDGQGGFVREEHAYHDFGRISSDIMNSYIVYALAEAGYSDIKKEFEKWYAGALSSKDPYKLALMANAAYAMGQPAKGNAALKELIASQAKDGSFTGTSHSITYSQGQSLIIETTALSIMALIRSGAHAMELHNAVHYLVGARSGSGVFSSTQGTILALKALTCFAKYNRQTSEDGKVAIYVDDKKVAEKTYLAGDKGSISLSGLEEFIHGEGKHSIKIKYIGVKTPLPYSVALNWSTSLPSSDTACVIGLKTHMAANTAHVGETVRLSSVLTNKKRDNVPSVMAVIGIPSGFTAQPWQLKELQEKHVFDYYEIKGNSLALYYRGMAAGAVKEINLDLKAEMPGEYDTPASTAYLYYTNEHKSWSAAGKISIKKI